LRLRRRRRAQQPRSRKRDGEQCPGVLLHG
jgi:hypothetical protein